jgi:hypothetical protein
MAAAPEDQGADLCSTMAATERWNERRTTVSVPEDQDADSCKHNAPDAATSAIAQNRHGQLCRGSGIDSLQHNALQQSAETSAETARIGARGSGMPDSPQHNACTERWNEREQTWHLCQGSGMLTATQCNATER